MKPSIYIASTLFAPVSLALASMPSCSGSNNLPSDVEAESHAATVPQGYARSFGTLKSSVLNPDAYLGFQSLPSYDVQGCADVCGKTNGCKAFNIFAEYQTVEGPADPCNKASVHCALYSAPVSQDMARNTGEPQNHIVVKASNGYNAAEGVSHDTQTMASIIHYLSTATETAHHSSTATETIHHSATTTVVETLNVTHVIQIESEVTTLTSVVPTTSTKIVYATATPTTEAPTMSNTIPHLTVTEETTIIAEEVFETELVTSTATVTNTFSSTPIHPNEVTTVIVQEVLEIEPATSMATVIVPVTEIQIQTAPQTQTATQMELLFPSLPHTTIDFLSMSTTFDVLPVLTTPSWGDEADYEDGEMVVYRYYGYVPGMGAEPVTIHEDLSTLITKASTSRVEVDATPTSSPSPGSL